MRFVEASESGMASRRTDIAVCLQQMFEQAASRPRYLLELDQYLNNFKL